MHERVENLAAALRKMEVAYDQLQQVATVLFDRIKLMALFSKHSGFREEQEWRLVYMNDRDHAGKLKPHLNYRIGARGVEPILKLPIDGHIPGIEVEPFTLESLIDRVLLGPSVSNTLTHMSMERMFDVLGLGGLKTKLYSSTIPLRPLRAAT